MQLLQPKLSREVVERIAADFNMTADVRVVAIRGYYANRFGKAGENDRGFFDDAAFILTKTHFSAWQFNCDPSKFGTHNADGKPKGIATVASRQVIWFKKGLHKGEYQAYRNDSDVQVIRDGTGLDVIRTQMGLNMHKGGKIDTSTWSLGCQTVPGAGWERYRDKLNEQLTWYDTDRFQYVIIDNADLARYESEAPQQPQEAPHTPIYTPDVESAAEVVNVPQIEEEVRSELPPQVKPKAAPSKWVGITSVIMFFADSISQILGISVSEIQGVLQFVEPFYNDPTSRKIVFAGIGIIAFSMYRGWITKQKIADILNIIRQ